LDAKVKVLSSPSNKEASNTKNLPSLPAKVQFSALAINGQWNISSVPLTSFSQPL
jgi:hypothetical protein